MREAYGQIRLRVGRSAAARNHARIPLPARLRPANVLLLRVAFPVDILSELIFCRTRVRQRRGARRPPAVTSVESGPLRDAFDWKFVSLFLLVFAVLVRLNSFGIGCHLLQVGGRRAVSRLNVSLDLRQGVRESTRRVAVVVHEPVGEQRELLSRLPLVNWDLRRRISTRRTNHPKNVPFARSDRTPKEKRIEPYPGEFPGCIQQWSLEHQASTPGAKGRSPAKGWQCPVEKKESNERHVEEKRRCAFRTGLESRKQKSGGACGNRTGSQHQERAAVRAGPHTTDAAQ